ncbi:hypothetical protein BC827DRAFT_1156559 [Russula dissimulans]|nr:hypothetical protein BC827DRAFT_1156559 [Russula dissimulans]
MPVASTRSLPTEILDLIFSFVPLPVESLSPAFPGKGDRLAWISVAHVCHQWREIVLSRPHLWGHIDFTTLSLAGAVGMLARSKDAPLHLSVDFDRSKSIFNPNPFNIFIELLNAYASRIHSLTITTDTDRLQELLRLLTWPVPALESLSLSASDVSRTIDRRFTLGEIDPDLFSCTTPRLIRLELYNCNINLRSPLLKPLRHLKLLYFADFHAPDLQSWLDAMGELSQLESLITHSATTFFRTTEIMLEAVHVVALPCLTQFHISATAKECELALAHLLLPVLTWLRVQVTSYHQEGGDPRAVIPHFARNAHGPQDATPLQSIVISGCTTRTDILLWTVPDADMEYLDNDSFTRATRSARAAFTASNHFWKPTMETTLYDAALSALPTSSLATLTVLNSSVVTRPLWLRYAPRWPSLKRIRLGCMVLPPFIDTMSEDPPPEGPLLPSLEELVITGSPLTMDTALRLRDMLLLRVTQRVPIQKLDLSECAVPADTMRLFEDIAADTRGPNGIEPSPRSFVWPAPLVDLDAYLDEYHISDWSDEEETPSSGSQVSWTGMWMGEDDDEDEDEDREESPEVVCLGSG